MSIDAHSPLLVFCNLDITLLRNDFHANGSL